MDSATKESKDITMFNHPVQWFKEQIKGWPIPNYCLFWFAVGCQLMLYVTGKIDLLSTVTMIGTILGVLCIVSINAAKSVNGILGMISAFCLIYVGFSAKNYLSCFEQVAYILTLDLPVIISSFIKDPNSKLAKIFQGWNGDTQNKLRKFTPKLWVISILSTLAVWIISSFAIGHLTNDPRPWIDGLSFAISLTAGIMCFFRFNNQYFWWTFSGIFQLILWVVTFAQGGATLAMAVSSSIYVINDIIAFVSSPWFNHGRRKMGLNEIK